MQRLDELDLAYLPMEEPAFSADPFPYLKTARQQHPWLARCAFGHVVLSHDANCWSDMLSEEDKRRTRPLWHYNHIPDDILPALRKAGVSQDHIDQMLVRNPRAIFEGKVA